MKVDIVSENPLKIAFSGAIAEDLESNIAVALDKLKSGVRSAVLDIESVESINSIGISVWISFLQQIPIDVDLQFINCPPVFIDYLNMVPPVIANGKVQSVLVPYDCPQCGKSWRESYEIAAEDNEFEDKDCGECGTSTEPAEDAEDFLGFLED